MPSRSAIVLLFLAACGVFGFTAHGYLESGDTEITLHAARAWWERGDPGLVRADKRDLLDEGEQTYLADHFIASNIEPALGPDGQPVAPSRWGMVGTNGKAYIYFPIGHQALFAPFVGVGKTVESWFPDPAKRFRAQRGEAYGELFWSRFLLSFVSPVCSAGLFVALAWIARRLGASPTGSLLIAAFATFCTQLWPGTNETMSNVPGTFLQVLAVAATVHYARGGTPRGTLLFCGAASGAAILMRYPQVITLLPFWLWCGATALRRRAPAELLWLALGGMPFAILLFTANFLRFGSILETGYSQNAGFGAFPVLWGLPSILVAWGKGILWFSPLILWVFWRLRHRASWGPATVSALASFLLPLGLFSGVVYWAAGQCWGIRYLSGPLALLTVCVLATSEHRGTMARPPRWLWILALAISLGGVLTCYVSQHKLAESAARQIYDDPPNVDQNVDWDASLSPIHSHWTYLVQSARGALREDPLGPVHAVFGIEGIAPPTLAAEDTGFRHLWWNWLPHWMPELPVFWMVAGWLWITLFLALGAVRLWTRDSTVHKPHSHTRR